MIQSLGLMLGLTLITNTLIVMRLPNQIMVVAEPEQEEEIPLNLSLVHDVVEALSEIISIRDYPQGRWFGTDGEHRAARNISVWMNETNLWTRFENVSSNTSWQYLKDLRLFYFDDDLQIINRTLNITYKGIRTPTNEFFISPRWNHTTFGMINTTNLGILNNTLLEPFIERYLNRSQLSTNFTEHDLQIVPRPHNISDNITHLIENHLNTILSILLNGDTTLLFIYLMTQFALENHLNYADMIQNPSNASTIPGFLQDTAGSCCQNPYVYIAEDPTFNPDPEQYIGENITEGIIQFLNEHHLARQPLLGSLADSLYKNIRIIEMQFWGLSPNFKGLILYDHNNNTYNEAYDPYCSRPIIYINRTNGLNILSDLKNNEIQNYTIDYHLEQYWNENIRSWNIIGQLNGTNPNKTILCGCLYDGLWNQASADSAVGMGIMLAIARYYKDNNITPMYTLRFVAFSGEEAGGRGAYSYAQEHKNDTIPIIIDL